MSRWKTIQKLILNNFIVDGIVDAVGGGSHTKLVTQYAIDQAIAALNLSGNNKLEVVNIRDFGVTPNVVIPGSGSTVTGTSIHTALNTAYTQLSNNQILYGGPGNWACFTTPNALSGQKTFNILWDGNIYCNGATFLTINQPGGSDRVHTIIIRGKIFGRVNDVTHTRSRWLAGTGPDFTTYTGQGILINQNVNSLHLKVSQIDGFESGIKMVQGAGNGSQENTYAVQKFNNNRYAVHYVSTDGASWCDKNIVTGWDGGHCRISGEVAIKIDGNAASSYNGAFRSNKFFFLAEALTRICEINGDVTEPKFDITIEAGLGTGIFDQANAIQCLSTGPNYVRDPKWCGQGVLNTLWMANGMGLNATIEAPVYLPNGSGDATTRLGNTGITDGSGTIIIDVPDNLSQSTRNTLPAHITVKSKSSRGRVKRITDANYTVVDGDSAVIIYNQTAARTVTLPTASSWPDRTLWVVQQKGNGNTLNLSQTWRGRGGATSSVLLNDNTVCLVSDGVEWHAVSEHL